MAILTRLFGSSTRGGVSTAEANRDVGQWLYEGGSSSVHTSSGQTITAKSALTLSAVYAAARAISEDVACMPLKAYRKLPEGGKSEAGDDAKWQSEYLQADVNLYTLVHHRANKEMTNVTLRTLLVWWASLYGSAYMQILRDGSGRPIGFEPIHPHRVRAYRDSEVGVFYEVRDPTGQTDKFYLFPVDVIKIVGPSDDGIVGNITTEYAAESFGIYMAAERHTGAFFGRGATLAGVIAFENKFDSQEALRAYKEAFNRKYAGAANAGQWMVADQGAKVTPFTVDPQKAQLLDTLRFQIEDVARWFRVPPVIIGHNTSTPYANIEPLGRFYHNFGLKPWAIRIEQELDRKLAGSSDDLFFEHVVDSLMWADAKSRSETHAIRIRSGIASPNEARNVENMNPYPGGEKFRIEQNLATMDEMGNAVQVNAPAASGPLPDRNEAIKRDVMPMMCDVTDRIIAREVNALTGKKTPSGDWIDKFYAGHRPAIVTALHGPLTTLARLAGNHALVVDDLSASFADRHIAASMSLIESDSDPSSWRVDRPAAMALELVEAVCSGKI